MRQKIGIGVKKIGGNHERVCVIYNAYGNCQFFADS